MDRATVNSEVVELLSRLTGYELRQDDVRPPVVFLTAVLAVLNGVIFADGAVADEEKEKLEKTLERLCASSNRTLSLAKMISDGFQQKKLCSLDNIITLCESLSEPEKLLLLSLGYEMSAADGDMDERERKYLKRIANNLEVEGEYQTLLESILATKKDTDFSKLEEIKSLLDPSRFRELDTIFVFAAEQIFEQLSRITTFEVKAQEQKVVTSYRELEKFKVYQQTLALLGENLLSTLKVCSERSVLSGFVTKELEQILESLHSQQFRVAVIGDFSQGKSTLLNALLGEEIQPTRAIPCSGTVSILKYGSEKRVVCLYKDETRQEISLEEYHDKVSIDKKQAIESGSEGLGKSNVKEITFEHPNLELCKNGVTIIDSPGLNEHHDRTSITQQMLKEIDAVIFLTDASRPLTQSERELIQELKPQLNGGDADQPAANLFIIVNKWDILDEESDRLDVKERTESIVFGQKPWIVGEQRIHYLSAQKALNAILQRKDNEYLKEFQNFTKSLEKFLVKERGLLKINQISTKMAKIIEASLNGFEQCQQVDEEEAKIYEAERLKILEEIGQISGFMSKLVLLVKPLYEQAMEEIEESFGEWMEALPDKLAQKAENWSSNYSAFWDKEELVKDYAHQFNRDLSEELNVWLKNKLQKRILTRYLSEVDRVIQEEIKSVEKNFSKYQDNFKEQLESEWSFYKDINQVEEIGITGNLLAAGLGAAMFVPAVIFAGPILAFLGILGGSSLFIGGIGDMFDLKEKIKAKVFETGWEQFCNSSDLNKIDEIIEDAFTQKLTQADELVSSAISIYEKNLKIIEIKLDEDQERKELTQAFITGKSQELQQLNSQIKEFLQSVS
jgi:predicted GTPase/uncharacterized tellurite resistance protein B-like protein